MSGKRTRLADMLDKCRTETGTDFDEVVAKIAALDENSKMKFSLMVSYIALRRLSKSLKADIRKMGDL